MNNRLARLRARIKAEGLDGFLVTSLANVRYLCGYSGSNGILLLTSTGGYFYTDSRYQEQAKTEVCGVRTITRERDLISDFPRAQVRGIKRLGFEKSFLSYASYLAVRRQLKSVRLIPCDNFTAQLRMVKDGTEQALIRRAAAIADEVLGKVLVLVKPGASEKDVAVEIDHQFLHRGEIAFPTIVASGPRGALPHAQPTRRKLRCGDAIVFDLGVRIQGYCSDMTRTVFLGRVSRKARRVYETVLDAQVRALGGVKAGAEIAAVDALARDHIKSQGYGPYFGHALGHGVGLEVHELPALNGRSSDRLQQGMVVTVEPGIYLPNWGGVRIEDLVLVTRQGCTILSGFSKRLMEL